jgi:hypothetical protein
MFRPQSTQSLGPDLSMKAPLADEYTNGEWSMTANPMSTEHGLPIRTQESFASSTTMLQPLSMPSGGLELPTNPTDMSCWSSFLTGPYTSFSTHMSEGTDDADYNELPQSTWGVPYYSNQEAHTQTMAPSEALLNGDYIHVGTCHDTDMDSYDDADVALPPSP